MGFRDRCAVSVAPIFLRIALGVTFLWAGAAKVFEEAPVRGEDAAVLANLGVISAPPKAPTPVEPVVTPPAGSAPAVTPPAPPADKGPGAPALMQLAQPPGTIPGYTAADFQSEVYVRALHKSLTLRLINAARPAEGMPLWPPRLAEGKWPIYFAWAVAMTELIGGCWLLLGLFTRFAAAGLTCVMLGAVWLTQLGPAIQSGHAYLGFLPRHPIFGVNDCGTPLYATLMWLLALLGGSLALFFMGSGALAIDRALFGGGSPSKPAD